MSDFDRIADEAEAEFEAFLAAEKGKLEQLLVSLSDDSEETRQYANKALELGAMILAARLRGEDTEFAEQALKAVKANLAATSSAAVSGTVLRFVESSIINVAVTVGRLILLL